jgi:hypothetical protein
LILETGYTDVRHDNNPILLNGQGIALVDMDTSSSPMTGLCEGRAGRQQDGILWSLIPELIEAFEPLLASRLTAEQLQKVEEIKELLRTEKEKTRRFMQFLEKNSVKRGDETVEWQPSIFKDRKIEELQKTINKQAVSNLGIALEIERKFFIWSAGKEEALTRLKAQEKIFDWSYPKSGNGYFVWA